MGFEIGSLNDIIYDPLLDKLRTDDLGRLDPSSINHNLLGNLQGGDDSGTIGEYYHLSLSEYSEITLFFENTDITGIEAEILTDGSNADSLHFHDSSNITFDSGTLTGLSSNNIEEIILEIETIINKIIDGSIGPNVFKERTVSSAGETLNNGDRVIYLEDIGVSYTFILPIIDSTKETGNSSRFYDIINKSSKKVTLQPSGGVTINGDPNFIYTKKYQAMTVHNDGTEWYIS